MTLTEFRSELKIELMNRADAASDNDRLDRWINNAYRHVCLPSVHKFREMLQNTSVALTAGTDSYSITTHTAGTGKATEILMVNHFDGTVGAPTATTSRRHLKPRSLNWWIRRSSRGSGSPTHYIIHGDSISLYPVPDVTGEQLRVWYWREPTPLSSGSHVTVLPDYWDQVVLKGAKWQAESSLGYRELAEATKQEYVSLINEVPDFGEFQADEDSDWGTHLETRLMQSAGGS
jgi:hypothetical protein